MKSKPLSRWWLLALNGIIAILFGIVAIFIPDTTLITLVMYFGIVILIIGIAMLWGAINSLRDNLPYFTDLITSVVTIVIGALLTFYTSKSLTIFVMIIGSWAVLVGIVQLYIATRSELYPNEKKRPRLRCFPGFHYPPPPPTGIVPNLSSFRHLAQPPVFHRCGNSVYA